jgi:transcriptional regulator with XRE-family HTH domain
MNALTLNIPVQENLTKRLVELRKAEGLTQVQVAKNLGITQGSYAHYERGLRRIPLDMIPRIAEAINTSEETLLGLEPKKGKRGPLSKLEKRFERVRTLPKKEQELAIDMLDRIINAAS